MKFWSYFKSFFLILILDSREIGAILPRGNALAAFSVWKWQNSIKFKCKFRKVMHWLINPQFPTSPTLISFRFPKMFGGNISKYRSRLGYKLIRQNIQIFMKKSSRIFKDQIWWSSPHNSNFLDFDYFPSLCYLSIIKFSR